MKEHFEKIMGVQGKEFSVEDIKSVPLEKIRTNPYQPRQAFDQEKIEELAQSIRTYGLLQPVILSKEEDDYIIVAGERRYLACKLLGWVEIPAIIRKYPHSSMVAVALIENIQREDLNFLEEAEGYRRLMEEFHLTQEVLAQRLGKSQSGIANKLRLLKLPDEIKDLLKAEKLSERHGRALLKLDCPQKQKEAVEQIMSEEMNVKEAEMLVEEIQKPQEKASEENAGDKLPGAVQPRQAQKKVVVRDARIFLNTMRQAVIMIKRSGLYPQVIETEDETCWEVRIRLPKPSSKKAVLKD